MNNTELMINKFNNYVKIISEFNPDQKLNINSIFYNDVISHNFTSGDIKLLLFLCKQLEEKCMIMNLDYNIYKKIILFNKK